MLIGSSSVSRGEVRWARIVSRGTSVVLAGLATVALLAGCAAETAGTAGPAPSEPPRETTTAPAPTPTPEPPTPEELRREKATQWVDSRTTRELVGSVIMVSVPGTDHAQLNSLMQDGAFGGFIIMGSNVPGTPEELKSLTDALTIDEGMPPLIGIDEEGGTVKRLPWDEYAGADTLRFGPTEEITNAFAGRGTLLAEAGVNVNFGIVADVTADPYSFIYTRTLGDTPQTAAAGVVAAVDGEHGRVASTLKHFPGHGAAPGDSHFAIPQTDLSLDAWRANEATPFIAGIDAGAELLMFGHLRYTQVSPEPASLSPEWYALARTELGFDGVTVTDDLGMLPASGLPEYQDSAANMVASLTAGADLALIIAGIDGESARALIDRVTLAVDEGTLPRERLREAALRTTELRLTLAEIPAA